MGERVSGARSKYLGMWCKMSGVYDGDETYRAGVAGEIVDFLQLWEDDDRFAFGI